MITLLLLGASAFVVLCVALWLLARTRWLVGFLAGTLGLGILAAALLLGLMTFRLFQYEPVSDQTILGTLTLSERSDAAHYRVALTQNQTMNNFEITGNQWRLSGSLLQVPRFLVIGPRERYFIVNRVEGRFTTLEDEMSASRDERGEPFYLLLADDALKRLFSSERLFTPLLPVASEAIFSLEFRAGTLRLRAVNEPAQEALSGG
ncbi:MAG: hypothetical protein LAT62_16040 [Natronospirillum sp.]|uniref:hypothetical protein n=1 Tax=Natronospirillum sp. TaxID=2812955 RepID=UPI0025E1D8E9|nr:hypothetical protein [Natronospirillum sp.]MCH8553448.1 hypothetical protein [Natronospirillum sp.]